MENTTVGELGQSFPLVFMMSNLEILFRLDVRNSTICHSLHPCRCWEGLRGIDAAPVDLQVGGQQKSQWDMLQDSSILRCVVFESWTGLKVSCVRFFECIDVTLILHSITGYLQSSQQHRHRPQESSSAFDLQLGMCPKPREAAPSAEQRAME